MSIKLNSFSKEAWHKTSGFKAIIWKSAFYYFLISLGLWALGIPLHLIGNALGIPEVTELILSLVQLFLFPPLIIGMVMLGVRRALDEPVEVEMMFDYYKKPLLLKSVNIFLLNWMIIALAGFTLRYLGKNLQPILDFHNILFAVMFLVVCLFLLIATFAFYFSCILVMHHQSMPFAAIKNAYNASLDHLWLLIKFVLFNIVVTVAGVLTLGILFIWTGPWLKLMLALMYRDFFITGTTYGSQLNNS